MAALARRAGASQIKLRVISDGRPDSSSQRGVEHALEARARPPQRLGQSGCVGVVVYVGRQPINFTDLILQRIVMPARQVRRIQHHTCLRIDWPRRNQPNSSHAHVGMLRANRIYRRAHAAQRIVGRSPRMHRRARLVQDFSLLYSPVRRQPWCRQYPLRCKPRTNRPCVLLGPRVSLRHAFRGAHDSAELPTVKLVPCPFDFARRLACVFWLTMLFSLAAS